jgi:hypothetical protein
MDKTMQLLGRLLAVLCVVVGTNLRKAAVTDMKGSCTALGAVHKLPTRSAEKRLYDLVIPLGHTTDSSLAEQQL